MSNAYNPDAAKQALDAVKAILVEHGCLTAPMVACIAESLISIVAESQGAPYEQIVLDMLRAHRIVERGEQS